jgi:hypothetical protein
MTGIRKMVLETPFTPLLLWLATLSVNGVYFP